MLKVHRAGRYTLTGLVGAGGFSDVYRAFDETLDAAVAVKVLRQRWADDDVVRGRFLREARLLRRVDDLHVIDVFDVGELEDGRPYLVMPLAAGGSLGERLTDQKRSAIDGEAQDRPIETRVAEMRRIVTSVAGGLRAIHAAGLVHRDVSPANLLLDVREPSLAARDDDLGLLRPGEVIVVGDLGLALNAESLTGLSLNGGTAPFSAPEQVADFDSVDVRADVYGATAVVFEVLTSQSPPLPHELEGAIALLPLRWREWFRVGLAVDADDRFLDISAWESAATTLLDASAEPTVAATRWPRDRCPFLGLAAFSIDDTAIFFGRERLADDLLDAALSTNAVLVGGPSGTGKSSLVRAGVLERLSAALGATVDEVVVVNPGDAPTEALGEALVNSGSTAVPPVVFVDQCEELFSQGATTEQVESFVDRIERLAEAGSTLIISLRADFYPDAARYPFLAELIGRHFFVGPMTRSELRQSLAQAARLGQLRLDGNLVSAVLEDAGDEPGALPLLSHAMEQTWIQREDDRLRLATYRDIGGVSGALARSAEELYTSLSDADRDVARSLWLSLVAVGDGSSPNLRRRLRRSDLDASQLAVLEHLIRGRLVVSDNAAVELAHETIISAWPRLVDWLDQERVALRELDRLSVAAESWQAAERNPDLLLRGTALERATEFVQLPRALRSKPVDQFVEESSRRYRRRLVLRRGAVIAVGLLAAVAVVGAIVATLGQQRAARAGGEAEVARATLLSERLAQIALSDNHDKDVSIALALEAVAHANTSAAMQAVGDLSMQTAGRRLVTVDLEARGVEVLWSPNGSWIATGEIGGQIRLVDPQSGELFAELRHPGGGLPAMSISPSGDLLAVGGGDGKTLLWNIDQTDGASPRLVETLNATDDGSVGVVAFSPDGSTLATGATDGRVSIFKTDTWGLVGTGSHEKAVWSVAYTPDSATLVSGSSDGRVQLWSGRTAENLREIDLGAPVWDVDVSADGTKIAVGSDGAARVVSLTGAPVAEFHSDCSDCSVWSVAFDPTGQFVASAGADSSARVFDLEALEETTYIRHDREVVFVDFHPTSQQVLSASKDGTTRITFFRASLSSEVATIEHGDWVWRARWSPDGRRMATVSSDVSAAIWEADSNPVDQTAASAVGFGEALDVAFVDDMVAVSQLSGSISMFDAHSGRNIVDLAHDAGIISIVGDPTRRSLLVGLEDGRAQVWDLTEASDPRRNELSLGLADQPGDSLAPVFDVAVVGPAQDRYAIATGDRVHIFDADTLNPVQSFTHPTVHRLLPLPNGDFISAGLDGSLHEWPIDADSDRPIPSYDTGPDDVTHVAAGTRSEILAVVSRSGVLVFDRDDGTRLPTPEVTATRVAAVIDGTTDDPGRTLIVTGGSDNDVIAWDARSGQVAWRHAFGDRVDELHQLDEGTALAIFGNGPHPLQIVDSATGDVLLERRATVRGLLSGAVSDDAQTLIAVGETGTLTRVEAPSQWVAEACRMDQRLLSDADRMALIGVSVAPIDPCGDQ